MNGVRVATASLALVLAGCMNASTERTTQEVVPTRVATPSSGGPLYSFDQSIGLCLERASQSGRRACSGPLHSMTSADYSDTDGVCLHVAGGSWCTGPLPLPLGDPYGLTFHDWDGICIADERWGACTGLPPDGWEGHPRPCLIDPTWQGYSSVEEAKAGSEAADRAPECSPVVPYGDGSYGQEVEGVRLGGPKVPGEGK